EVSNFFIWWWSCSILISIGEAANHHMAGGKVYSFEEVRKHSDRKDCWLIIAGKVYDVTPFMEEHPGGDEVLLASV
ncbi:hypothetical protein ACJX0J_026115, partial [Zea mays]